MVEACGKVGMKPVCDHPSYCRNDRNALYMGQRAHLEYAPHRGNAAYFPKARLSPNCTLVPCQCL